ncbi:MAG: hypothetical protein RML72_11735 [Bacteroidia bacterium]|nr:hypothetical protein [Bacteroidia bacterium]MDW8159528.1 hypothetical protein [Bacteroidia bacterium]
MKYLSTLIVFIILSYRALFSQQVEAQIDWTKINPLQDSAILIEYKGIDSPQGMHNMRMDLFSISDSQPVGLILENHKVKKFILLVRSKDPNKIASIEEELKQKFPGPELVLTRKTIAELQAEFGH